ncbi:hypothetical protein ACU635_01665 [[Actinomadura] parvosata]
MGQAASRKIPPLVRREMERIATVLGVCVARQTPPDGSSGKDAA